ncbi:MAG: hypothetical protein IJL91_05495 [Bacteroidales bacterium]|nr:hypothetical protein [Bacteroidales bacterium]
MDARAFKEMWDSLSTNEKSQLIDSIGYIFDGRTFPEVWDSLSKLDQDTLYAAMMEKLHITRVTFWHWKNGNFAPQKASSREAIARLVNEITGNRTHPATLFGIR